jgi:tellurite methyltransferase
MPKPSPLTEQFGSIDIYLFDQLLRGRLVPGQRLLDAGCGKGRNLVYFLRNGFDVHAVDGREANVEAVRARMRELAPALPLDRARVATVEALPYDDDAFDAVISNAVLHFARDEAHFDTMVAEMVRVLAPGGLLFARLASDIGLESAVKPLGAGRYALPDGSERYLVNEQRLLDWTARCAGRLLDPIKTTNVQGLRCMTTWVVRLPEPA